MFLCALKQPFPTLALSKSGSKVGIAIPSQPVHIALAVVLSGFSIPIGASKCFPIQHMVNVIAGTLLGPWYAVGMAFVTSLIRLIMGTGTLLAFPGSMVGALCCGLAFRYIFPKWSFAKRVPIAFLGEIIGTGILGAMAAFPIATFVMGKEAALFTYVIPFGVSTVGGALIASVLMFALAKTGVINMMFRQTSEKKA